MLQKVLASIFIAVIGFICLMAMLAFSYGCVYALVWAVCTIISYPMLSYLHVLAIWIILIFIKSLRGIIFCQE